MDSEKNLRIIAELELKKNNIIYKAINSCITFVPTLEGKQLLIVEDLVLKDGSFHPVDSDQLSFELAAKMGFKAAAKAAGAVILEPIMKNEVVTPEENMGDIVGDLNRRRGQVNSMSDRSGAKVIKAEVPLSEMFGYVTTLRTLSSGRATSTMEFSHYAETPSNISEEVIKAAKGSNE